MGYRVKPDTLRPPTLRPPTLRLDKLLFFLRIAHTRSLAQEWASAGHIRIGGRRIERPAHGVAVGDVVPVLQWLSPRSSVGAHQNCACHGLFPPQWFWR